MTPHDSIEISRTTPGLDAVADARLHKTTAALPGTQDMSRTPASEPAKGDRIELSLAARALSTAEDPEIAARRGEHADAMRGAIASGELASPERVERAVRRLLGG